VAARDRWLIKTSAGDHEADVLITACGQLSVPKLPTIKGLETFEGPAFHTAEWRHDVDLSGKRVAVVGTGCSAIQVVAAIHPIVHRLSVYNVGGSRVDDVRFRTKSPPPGRARREPSPDRREGR
jgi:cation diffusion facilitator CzcD-associated flavoprotein CzcO